MRKVNSMLAIIVVLLLTGLVFGELPKYVIIDLGTLGGTSCYPSGINDAGQVVGRSWTAEGTSHGFLWDDVNGMMNMTDMLDENSPWDEIDSAMSINNNGQIIGSVSKLYSGWPRPIHFGTSHYLWDSETGFVELTAFDYQGLGLLGNNSLAINDSMQVVGTKISLDYHASLWDSINGVTDLGTLGGDDSSAFNINESGMVVGSSMIGLLSGDQAHAFLWNSENGMIDLGALSSNDSSAWAINNFDTVVGASAINESNENWEDINHAFIWSEANGMIDIHDSIFTNSIALGING